MTTTLVFVLVLTSGVTEATAIGQPIFFKAKQECERVGAAYKDQNWRTQFTCVQAEVILPRP